MIDDVFSFDDFLNKNGGVKKIPTNSIKERFSELDQEKKEMIKESQKQDEIEDCEIEEVNVEDDLQEYENEETTNESAFVQNVEEDDEYYKLYQDKNEEFSCDIMVEGSSPDETYARIIVESENWSLVFPGEIRGGKCIVPIKKLNILKEGEIGNIKLEVVAEGNLFIPWENQFKVKVSKKVVVNVNEGKKPVKKPNIPGKIGVKVNVK